MSNLHLDISFQKDDRNGLVGPPRAHIYVKSFSSSTKDDDHRYISPECVSARELDEAVEFLHKELEKIRARGHQLFAAATKS
jgi:hypothetical protein